LESWVDRGHRESSESLKNRRESSARATAGGARIIADVADLHGLLLEQQTGAALRVSRRKNQE
jgi:hypothetical protein